MLLKKDYYAVELDRKLYKTKLSKIVFKDISVKSIKYAMSIEYYDPTGYNNASVEVKIYTDGELNDIEFEKCIFPCVYNGYVHYPGSYSSVQTPVNLFLKTEKEDYSHEILLNLKWNSYLSEKYGYSDLSKKEILGEIFFNTLLKFDKSSFSSDMQQFLDIDFLYNKYIVSKDLDQNYFIMFSSYRN